MHHTRESTIPEILDERVEHGRACDGEGHHDDEVGEEGKHAEHDVSALAEPGFDDLQEGLSPGRTGLQHDGQDSKQDDLDGSAAGVPVGSGDSILEIEKKGHVSNDIANGPCL